MRRALWLWVALGCIAVPVSELMFWPVHLRDLPGAVAVYGAAGLMALGLVERAGALGWAPLVLSAGVFGWLIEGVIVGTTYEDMPFSLSWTPLAWHGLLTVGIGLVAIRQGLIARRVWPGVAVLAATGVFAGLWAAQSWPAFARDMGDALPAQGFPVQIVTATACLALGHRLLDLLPPGKVPDGVLAALALAAATVWGLVWAVPLFPVSLAVPALIAVAALLIRRSGEAGSALRYGRIPLRRYAGFALVPALAILVHDAVAGWGGLDVLHIWVALPTTVAGAAIWLWAATGCAVHRTGRA
ncbi:hypothetical protein [Roseicyclus mahoneyensis]|uniref:Uncharacterized protein n=1 Tax=Roseicyclus mahoneyensis TaxID=164332 RepID=A0A316GHK8_9RHOB|nr:hypothetical protein [Roseicyclus mahoneyensis]PWK60546.1 hypothetical protein C7455_104183 [Roseicyclus mahoneyensis]